MFFDMFCISLQFQTCHVWELLAVLSQFFFFILQGLYCFSFMCCIAFGPAQDPRGVGVPHELTPGSKGWKTRNGEMGE